MVETTSLENWYTRKGIEGSNPSLSAQLRSIKSDGTSLSRLTTIIKQWNFVEQAHHTYSHIYAQGFLVCLRFAKSFKRLFVCWFY